VYKCLLAYLPRPPSTKRLGLSGHCRGYTHYSEHMYLLFVCF